MLQQYERRRRVCSGFPCSGTAGIEIRNAMRIGRRDIRMADGRRGVMDATA